jgi:tetratricopeptide (TPR) repeat protein
MLARHALSRTGLYAAALVVGLSFGIPQVSAIGTDTPAPSTDKKKEKDKKSMIDQQRDYAKFLEGYRAARDMILAGHYNEGIAALHALHRDDNPDVANYIGYANRKLGNYEQSKLWYEAALKADPNHARTWSYYGMWQAEQGNRLKAEDFLQKVKLICGNETCTEFKQLRAVIDGKASY